MSSLQLAADYLLYRLRSIKLHGVHSPFVFDLYQNVIQHDGFYPAYQRIEDLRQKLRRDGRTLQVTDFGAGPKAGQKRARAVNEIARTSAKPAKYGQLLFRLANRFQPKHIWELGTSLGITTSYLAEARKNSSIKTFEGCPNVGAVAKANFDELEFKNIQVVPGNLDETLSAELRHQEKLDFVFFDGNHRYEPTMRYFNACLAKHHANSLFVLDDIYWSKEMKRAWADIKRHPQVCQTVDLFFIGLVFFKKSQPKEHFTLAF